jgi:preprotein translocase subunit SecA
VRTEAEPDPLLAEPPPPDFSRLRETTQDPALDGDDLSAEASADAASAPRRAASGQSVDPRDPSTWGKVSRNAACPCGSGKKFKHCHGRV